eukprot:scaffold37331_cov55-Attheya_sp.AAC.1
MESNPPIRGDHHGDRTGETMSTTLTRKRDREEDRIPTRIADQSTPHMGPRCCNCTSKATCATKRCLCRKAGRDCRRGDCHAACCNLPDTLLCLNAAPALPTHPAVPLTTPAITVSTEDPTQPGILLLEQQPSDTQESVATDPVATEETTATTESDDQEELPIGDLPNQVPTDTDRKLMGVY